jgi:hypothetical protein
MLELQELRTYIENGRYADALVLLGEMDEMSYDDKVNKIGSFVEILLLHLIKRQAEQRTTRSWDISIRNAVRQIVFTNKRRKAGGFFLLADELQESIAERYDGALSAASLEAFEGRYEAEEIDEMVDKSSICATALALILDAQSGQSN